MKKYLSPPVTVGLSVLVLVALIVFFGLLPLVSKTNDQRTQIDATRTLIASLGQQQRNIEAVSKNFTRLAEQDTLVGSAFLNERKSVEFFNALDALGDQAGVLEFQKRLDAPGQQAQQLVGLHLEFSANFESALELLNGLHQLNIFTRPNGLTITRGTGLQNLHVVLDAFIPWETAS